jgi:hypothetical protein
MALLQPSEKTNDSARGPQALVARNAGRDGSVVRRFEIALSLVLKSQRRHLDTLPFSAAPARLGPVGQAECLNYTRRGYRW